MTRPPGLRPFFSFYGSKWRAAYAYPVPLEGAIVEPFAGSAGYSLRYHDRRVLLVERDPVIASVWRYLLGVSAAEVRRLPLLGHDQTVDDLHVSQEARWLVGFWLNKGSERPRARPSAWMRDPRFARQFWGAEIRERIASQVDLIRHWRLVEGSYETATDIAATWFVDPPYERAGRHYRFSSVDFAHLAGWCRERRGLVIVCENAGASWLPFRVLGSFKANESRTGGKRSAEVMWTNESEAA